MKNILLLGASRSGKTTFSRMLREQYPIYQIICSDSIRGAYKRTINKDANLTSHEVGETDEYRNFIREVFNRFIKYNADLKYILDTVDILPQHIPLFNQEDLIILVFGYPKATDEEIVKIQRKNDTENDWTFDLSDKEILDNANFWIEKSKEFESDCRRLNVKFIDVSFNREKILKDLLQWVIEENENDRKI